jgi:hypothetical protein
VFTRGVYVVNTDCGVDENTTPVPSAIVINYAKGVESRENAMYETGEELQFPVSHWCLLVNRRLGCFESLQGLGDEHKRFIVRKSFDGVFLTEIDEVTIRKGIEHRVSYEIQLHLTLLVTLASRLLLFAL